MLLLLLLLQAPKDRLQALIAEIQPSIKETQVQPIIEAVYVFVFDNYYLDNRFIVLQEEIVRHTEDLKKFSDEIEHLQSTISTLEKEKQRKSQEQLLAVHKPERF